MKQVSLTPELKRRLQAAAGDGVDVSKHPVFEATGLNTQPVRKEHPLYKGAKHTRNYLQQMAAEVNKESRPLQIMHNDADLPAGRVFYGEVLDSDSGPELRLLFWVDPSQTDTTDLINNGTLDQVSVSTLAQAATCSMCGWNFIGGDSDFETNIMAGLCNNGHQLGQNGAHVVMNDLGDWYEMSLVGRGGARGARICSSTDSVLTGDYRLAASGQRISPLALTLSAKDLEPVVDPELLKLITSLSTQVTELGAKLDASKPKDDKDANTNEPAVGSLDALTQRLMSLEEIVKSMSQTTKATDGLTTPKATTDADSGNFLLDGSPAAEFAKKLLIMSGDVEAKLPKDPKEAIALLTEKLDGIKTAAGKAAEAASGSTNKGDADKPKSVNAFKVR
jgi:hypothetical protein